MAWLHGDLEAQCGCCPSDRRDRSGTAREQGLKHVEPKEGKLLPGKLGHRRRLLLRQRLLRKKTPDRLWREEQERVLLDTSRKARFQPRKQPSKLGEVEFASRIADKDDDCRPVRLTIDPQAWADCVLQRFERREIASVIGRPRPTTDCEPARIQPVLQCESGNPQQRGLHRLLERDAAALSGGRVEQERGTSLALRPHSPAARGGPLQPVSGLVQQQASLRPGPSALNQFERPLDFSHCPHR